MKLIVIWGSDDGMFKQDPHTPAVAITAIDGVIWEGRGITVDHVLSHLAKRLNEAKNYDLDLKNPDFDHVRPKKSRGKYDT